MNRFNVIQLDEHFTNCALCGVETAIHWSVPMYEGKIVNTFETDEWAGMPVCKGCYDCYSREVSLF